MQQTLQHRFRKQTVLNLLSLVVTEEVVEGGGIAMSLSGFNDFFDTV